jgi:hypothetical protein
MTILKSNLAGAAASLATCLAAAALSQASSIFIQWKFIPIWDWTPGTRAVLLMAMLLLGLVAWAATTAVLQANEYAQKELKRKQAEDARRAPEAPLKVQRLKEEA